MFNEAEFRFRVRKTFWKWKGVVKMIDFMLCIFYHDSFLKLHIRLPPPAPPHIPSKGPFLLLATSPNIGIKVQAHKYPQINFTLKRDDVLSHPKHPSSLWFQDIPAREECFIVGWGS